MDTGRNIHHSAIHRAVARARAAVREKVPDRSQAARAKATGPLASSTFCFIQPHFFP